MLGCDEADTLSSQLCSYIMSHLRFFYLPLSLAPAELSLECCLDYIQPFENSTRCVLHMVFETRLFGTYLEALQCPNKNIANPSLSS